MPGNVKSKDWSGSKIFLWRILFLVLLIIVTPLLLVIGGPLFVIAICNKNDWFRTKCWSCSRVAFVFVAIVLGILLEPVLILVVAISIQKYFDILYLKVSFQRLLL